MTDRMVLGFADALRLRLTVGKSARHDGWGRHVSRFTVPSPACNASL
jgi:hypothetical protein